MKVNLSYSVLMSKPENVFHFFKQVTKIVKTAIASVSVLWKKLHYISLIQLFASSNRTLDWVIGVMN